MKDDALAYFKGNASANRLNYIDANNKWIYEKYSLYKGQDCSPFGEFKLEVLDFKMDMSADKPENTDWINAKILYKSLMMISDTQASDERFWVGLAHADLWDYMLYRCKLTEENAQSNKILINYFFNYGNKRSLIVHPLARLWWVGRLIYNKNATEQFDGLEYFKTDFAGKTLTMFSNNYTNNPSNSRVILKCVMILENAGEKINIVKFREILRYVNQLGGIIVIDYLTEKELQEKIIHHYCEMYKISPNMQQIDIKQNQEESCNDINEKVVSQDEKTEKKKSLSLEKNIEVSSDLPLKAVNLDSYIADKIIELNQKGVEIKAQELKNAQNKQYSQEILGSKYPFIRKYNPNLTMERQAQYMGKRGVYNEVIYNISGQQFLVIKSSLGVNKDKFDNWINKMLENEL